MNGKLANAARPKGPRASTFADALELVGKLGGKEDVKKALAELHEATAVLEATHEAATNEIHRANEAQKSNMQTAHDATERRQMLADETEAAVQMLSDQRAELAAERKVIDDQGNTLSALRADLERREKRLEQAFAGWTKK